MSFLATRYVIDTEANVRPSNEPPLYQPATPWSGEVPRLAGNQEISPSPRFTAGLRPHEEALLGDVLKRIGNLESQFKSYSQRPVEKSNPGLVQALHDLIEPLNRVESYLSSIRPTSPSSRQAPESTQPEIPELSIQPSRPRLRVATDKTKLFGPNHWLHTAEQLQMLGKFDDEDVELSLQRSKADLVAMVKRARNKRHSIKTQNSVALHYPVPDLLGTLPDKHICDELADGYLRTFEPIYRILHIPSFWREYERFWGDQQSTPPAFRMKLILVLAIGTTFHPDTAEHERLRRLAHMWIYAAQWWLARPSEKLTHNLDGIQVGCLLHLARQTSSMNTSSWLSMGIVLRMAMFMGLHHDPDKFPALSPFQTQMRRRLWATILELTILSTLDSAVPLHISVQDFDTRPPLNLDDEDLGPETRSPANPKPDATYTDASIQRFLLKSFPLRLHVAQVIGSCHGPQSYNTTLELGAKLRAACRELASLFEPSSSSSPAISKPGTRPPKHTKFQRRYLDMYLRRYILLLHRPFMVQARSNPCFYLARKVCLESATVVAPYAADDDLNLPAEPRDDLSRLMIGARGSMKGPLSLDVITILGLELITQLEEEAGPGSVSAAGGLSVVVAGDPLDEMAKARRAPLIRTLEHLNEQFLRIMGAGNPKVKRYGFLSAILGQVRAMEARRPHVAYDTICASLERCLPRGVSRRSGDLLAMATMAMGPSTQIS